MIRMICINNKPLKNAFNTDLHLLVEGESYEGILVDSYNYYNEPSTAFCIPSISIEFGWSLERFIPCSDIDETELVNEKELLNS